MTDCGPFRHHAHSCIPCFVGHVVVAEDVAIVVVEACTPCISHLMREHIRLVEKRENPAGPGSLPTARDG
jgi:hypothetical protein